MSLIDIINSGEISNIPNTTELYTEVIVEKAFLLLESLHSKLNSEFFSNIIQHITKNYRFKESDSLYELDCYNVYKTMLISGHKINPFSNEIVDQKILELVCQYYSDTPNQDNMLNYINLNIDIHIIVFLLKYNKVDFNTIIKTKLLVGLLNLNIYKCNITLDTIIRHNILDYIFSAKPNVTTYYKSGIKYFRIANLYDLEANVDNIYYYNKHGNDKILVKNVKPKDTTIIDTNIEPDNLINFLLSTSHILYGEYLKYGTKGSNYLDQLGQLFNDVNIRSILDEDYKYHLEHNTYKIPNNIPNLNLECHVSYNKNEILTPNTIINSLKGNSITASVINFRTGILLKVHFNTSHYFLYYMNEIIFPPNTSFIVTGEPYKVGLSIIVPATIYSQNLSVNIDTNLSNIYNNRENVEILYNKYNYKQVKNRLKSNMTIDSINLSNYYTTKILQYLDKVYINNDYYNTIIKNIVNKVDISTNTIILNNKDFIVNYLNINNIELNPILFFYKYFPQTTDFMVYILDRVKCGLYKIYSINTYTIDNYIEDHIDFIRVFIKYRCIDLNIVEIATIIYLIESKVITSFDQTIIPSRFIFSLNYTVNTIKRFVDNGIEYTNINNKYYFANKIDFYVYNGKVYFLARPAYLKNPIFIEKLESWPFLKYLQMFKLDMVRKNITQSDASQFYDCFNTAIYNPIFESQTRELLDVLEMDYEYFKENGKFENLDRLNNTQISNLVFCNMLLLLYYYTGSDGFTIMGSYTKYNKLPKDLSKYNFDFDDTKLNFIPIQNHHDNIKSIKCLNKYFWEVHSLFLKVYKIEPCIIPKNIFLYRGVNITDVPIFKGSIVNSLKNQFVSYSASFTTAKRFTRADVIHMLELNIERDIVIPIGDMQFYARNVSTNRLEDEFLLPLNTSFIVSGDIFTYDEHLIIPLKIHTQSKPKFNRYNNIPFTGLFTKEELIDIYKF
jgi:hypothetical protein